jgi:hypothetical protein
MYFNKIEQLVAVFDGVAYDIIITWDRNKNCNFYYLNGKERKIKMKVCWQCLRGIECREGQMATICHCIDPDDYESVCDWCKLTADEGGFDELYELV